MQHKLFIVFIIIFTACMFFGCSTQPTANKGHHGFIPTGSEEENRIAAEDMIRAAEGNLAPVYAPLAEQIVTDYDLDAMPAEAIGIDIGSGPGQLIFELAERTEMRWVNADINPWFFSYFYEHATKRGVAHRVSAIYADAQNMPFRDDYADVFVSRGSYPFWPDQQAGFAEIYRVLKPGGVAYIGRGFPRDMPLNTARAIRGDQGKAMNYNTDAKVNQLKTIMRNLGITTYRIETPTPAGVTDLTYGVWIEIRKPD